MKASNFEKWLEQSGAAFKIMASTRMMWRGEGGESEGDGRGRLANIHFSWNKNGKGLTWFSKKKNGGN